MTERSYCSCLTQHRDMASVKPRQRKSLETLALSFDSYNGAEQDHLYTNLCRWNWFSEEIFSQILPNDQPLQGSSTAVTSLA